MRSFLVLQVLDGCCGARPHREVRFGRALLQAAGLFALVRGVLFAHSRSSLRKGLLMLGGVLCWLLQVPAAAIRAGTEFVGPGAWALFGRGGRLFWDAATAGVAWSAACGYGVSFFLPSFVGGMSRPVCLYSAEWRGALQ